MTTPKADPVRPTRIRIRDALETIDQLIVLAEDGAFFCPPEDIERLRDAYGLVEWVWRLATEVV